MLVPVLSTVFACPLNVSCSAVTLSGFAPFQLPVLTVSALCDFAPYRIIKSATSSVAAAVPLPRVRCAPCRCVGGGAGSDVVLALAPMVLCRGSAGLESARQGLAAASFGPRPLGEARVVAAAGLVLSLPDWEMWERGCLGPPGEPHEAEVTSGVL